MWAALWTTTVFVWILRGRPTSSTSPDSLIAATQVVATEFATIAAANNYWR